MIRNMSTLDRRLRAFIVAPIAIVLAVVAGVGSIVGIVLLALAAVMILTSTVGVCPTYRLIHLDTRRRKALPH